MRKAAFALALLFASSTAGSAVPAAEEPRFQPEVAFPADSLAYLSVASVKDLRGALAQTLPGRIATHPGVRAALGALPGLALEKIKKATAEFTAVAGVDIFTALDFLSGEVAFAFAGVDTAGMPRLVLALELGPNREAILNVLARIDGAVSAKAGSDLPGQAIQNRPVTYWPLDAGSVIARAVLGTHVVFSTSGDLLASVILAHEKAPERKLADAPFLAALKSRFGPDRPMVSRPSFLVAADAAGIVKLAREKAPERDREDMERVFRVSGIDGVGGAGLALGFRDGALETRIHIATPGGARGVIGALAAAISEPKSIDAALALVPEDATSISALRLQPGRCIELLEKVLAEGGVEPGGLKEAASMFLGISIDEDLKPLPPLDIVAFSRFPPAGSLFEDTVVLARAEELKGYESLAKKLSQGAEPKSLDAGGRKILYTDTGAAADLGGGVWAIAGNTMTLRRLLAYSGGVKKLGDSPALLQKVRARLQGAAYASFYRANPGFLAAYNTIVSLATTFAPIFGAQLKPFGVDPAFLPPGEEFLPHVKDGFLRLESTAEGVSVVGQRVIENSGLLPIVAVVSVAAGVAVPSLMSARARAEDVSCMSNLREIQKLAMITADMSGSAFYPYSEKGSIDAFMMLVKSHEGLPPGVFRCLAARDMYEAANVDADGKFELSEKTCSYELVPWKVGLGGPIDALLAFDRTPCHRGSRNVIFAGGNVEEMDEAEFQKKLVAERERFAKPAPEKTPEKAPEKAKKKKASAKKASKKKD